MRVLVVAVAGAIWEPPGGPSPPPHQRGAPKTVPVQIIDLMVSIFSTRDLLGHVFFVMTERIFFYISKTFSPHT